MYRRPFPRGMAIGVAHHSPGAPAPPQPAFRYDYFVSPTGSPSNPGTFESPWNFEYARAGAGGLIVPPVSVPNLGYVGIGYRGGQYLYSATANFNNANGAKRGGLDDPDGKIIYRNFNGEHAEWINDSASKSVENIQISGPYQWFWGIDAWRKHTDRYNYPGPGSNWYLRNAATNGVKLIHCHGHEGSNGLFTDSAFGNAEIYGCYFYHAGTSVDPRAHGFYCHHTRDSGESGSRLKLSECVSFDHLGTCGQIFASSSPEQLDDIDILGLVAWGGGRLASTTAMQNLTIGGTDGSNIPLRGFTGKFIISRNHVGYGRSCFRFYNNGSTGQDAVLEDEYLVGGTGGTGVGRLTIMAMSWSDFQHRRGTIINLEQTQMIETDDNSYTNYSVWEDVAYFGSDPTSTRWRGGSGFTDRTLSGWQTFSGKGTTPGHADTAQTSLPSTTKVFIRPTNKFEYGRGHVIVFNWASLPRYPVDLSSFLAVGDRIVVRNVQDQFGATINVYDAPTGGNIVNTWLGATVYIDGAGVAPPALYGYNNAALDAVQYTTGAQYAKTATLSPGFDMFIVSTS